MNERDLIASIIDSLAWPVVVLAILLTFRKPLARFVSRLKRVKYGSFEAEAEAEVVAAEQALSGGEPAPRVFAPESIPDSKILQHYRALATVSPRAAIVEAWASFETAVQSRGMKLGIIQPGAPVVFPEIFAKLLNSGVLTMDEVAALTRFRNLRNKLVHDPSAEVLAATAVRYAMLLHSITERVRGLAK